MAVLDNECVQMSFYQFDQYGIFQYDKSYILSVLAINMLLLFNHFLWSWWHCQSFHNADLVLNMCCEQLLASQLIQGQHSISCAMSLCNA